MGWGSIMKDAHVPGTQWVLRAVQPFLCLLFVQSTVASPSGASKVELRGGLCIALWAVMGLEHTWGLSSASKEFTGPAAEAAAA